MLRAMTDHEPRPDDDRDLWPRQEAAQAPQPPATPCFDWQVLLLRYLPEPTGCAHAVKRFSAR